MSNNINEGKIPLNLKWRSGINNTVQNINDPFCIGSAFINGLNANKPPKVELPPIKKSKRDQYIDALLNNGVIWKTTPEDPRPETNAELQAIQNPIMITEPLLEEYKSELTS